MKTTMLTAFLAASVLCCNAQHNTEKIKLNQLGFFPKGQKLAVITDTKASDFEVKTVDLKKTVFQGTLSPEKEWNKSGEKAKVADFTTLTKPGKYVLVIKGEGQSFPFSIESSVLNDLLKSSLKAYYYNRASIELLPKYAGKYARPEGHPDNQVIVLPSAASGKRPAGTVISTPGGWYDAGDYNKYIVNSGISTYTLLSAYENYPLLFDTLQFNIPESGNGIPDILNEALWNIRWMVTMQDPNDGGVYNKTTNAGFDPMILPHLCKTARYVTAKGTAAALDFASVMAVCSRVYKKYLPAFADSCLQRAQNAWNWAKANPNKPFTNPKEQDTYPSVVTGEYGDPHLADEFQWAAAELYLATGNDSYYKEIGIEKAGFTVPSWGDVRTLGLLSLSACPKMPTATADVQLVQKQLLALADSLKDFLTQKSPYKISADSFVWGSNSDVANQGMILMAAYKLTHNSDYLNAAISDADYLLGRNATGYCFVTGFGSHYPLHIHHRPSVGYGFSESVPGFLSGGPNPYNQYDCQGVSNAYPSSLPAKCFADNICSYSTNEVTINWNAPLVYLAGALLATFAEKK
jgi:endoglucanase